MTLLDKKPALEDIGELTPQLEESMENDEVPMNISMQFSVAVDEIYSNIVYYSGAQHAQVDYCFTPGRVELCFRDDGVAYNPLEKDDPDVTLSAEERGIGGLGIFLVKKFMTSMEYKRVGNQNVLTLVKEF